MIGASVVRLRLTATCHRNICQKMQQTNPSVIVVILLCTVLLVRIEQCIGVVTIERNFDHGGRMIMICSSENVSIEISSQHDANVQQLLLTCNSDGEMETIDIWWYYIYANSLIGPSRGGSLTVNVDLRNKIHTIDVGPGMKCTLNRGYYNLKGVPGNRIRYYLPNMTCTIPALPPIVDQSTVTAHEGDEVNLTCINPNNPDDRVSLKWLDMDGNTVSTNATYTIETTTRNDTGVYTCVLTGVNNYTEECNATVKVHYLELYAQGPFSHSVTTGSNLSLSCIYDGVPIPLVQWIYNGVELEENDEVEVTNQDGWSVLALRDVGVNSDGIYSCQAENSVGRDLLGFTVTVVVQEQELTSVFQEWTDLVTTDQASTTNESTSEHSVTPVASRADSNLLVMASILIPVLLISSLVATSMFLVVFCYRWWRARKFNSYHIHFHLHSELDLSFVPIQVEVKQTFTRSMETIIDSRSYSDDDVKCYSIHSDAGCDDTESLTSQRLSELGVSKPDSLIGYCDSDDSSGACGAIVFDDNYSERTQSNNLCSPHLNMDCHELEEEATVKEPSSVRLKKRQDYVFVDIMQREAENDRCNRHEDVDIESECGSEILQSEYHQHDGECVVLNSCRPENNHGTFTLQQDSEVVPHTEQRTTTDLDHMDSGDRGVPASYITSDMSTHKEWRTRIIQDESPLMVDEKEEDVCGSFCLDVNSNAVNTRDTIEIQTEGYNEYDEASDLDTTLLETHTESFNQWKPNHLAGDDILSCTGGYVSEPRMASVNFDVRFAPRKHYVHSGYIPSDESGYYSSQIPSECDSSYKLRQLEDEDFLVLGVDEETPHLTREHPLIAFATTSTLGKCDKQSVSTTCTQDEYLRADTLSPSPTTNTMGTRNDHVQNDITSHFQSEEQDVSDSLDLFVEDDGTCLEDIMDAAAPLSLTYYDKPHPPLSSLLINVDHTQSLNSENDDHTCKSTSSIECSSSYVTLPTSTSTKILNSSNTNSPVTTTDGSNHHHCSDNETRYSLEGEFEVNKADEQSPLSTHIRENGGDGCSK